MSSKTRIIVLHMKEIIYTAVFLALAVVLAVILFFMFGPGKTASDTASEKSRYKPGVYTSSITLNDNTFDVEVTVNADKIKAIRFLSENGAFLVTRSGEKIAKYFGISKYTLYSYLDKSTGGQST